MKKAEQSIETLVTRLSEAATKRKLSGEDIAPLLSRTGLIEVEFPTSDETSPTTTTTTTTTTTMPAPFSPSRKASIMGFTGPDKPLITGVEEVLQFKQKFKNWGETIQRFPSRWFKPKKKQDLILIVKAAIAEKKKGNNVKLRVSACGHSWSDVFIDEGSWLIDVTSFEKKMELIKDQKKILPSCKKYKTVKLSPGVTTGDLQQFLVDHNVCIKSDVILETVYYTGVVATASHGTGNTEATVSDYAVAMKIVQYMPDGSVQEVEYKDPEFYSDSKTSKEEFSAVRCNLGLFGVISEITFRVDDMLSVQVRNDKPRVSEYFPEDYMNTKNDALKELVENVFGVEIFWVSILATISFYHYC
jgi:hypothetical protein